ncbi:MAG: putative nucleotidyltransferase substrate binding domain-containing protein [Gammaproteobacteria bacterium]|nr:putative nucleotidyltransferase substrate binding domain-containing protein [Gammaproteobacteria bacterium]
MDVELLEIRDFLAAHHPFDQLPDGSLSTLVGKIEIRYFKRESTVLEPGQAIDHLHILRSGAVEVTRPDGELLARLAEGDLFGYRALLEGGTVQNRVEALEDCLVYLLPIAEIDALCEAHPQIAYFFGVLGEKSLGRAIQYQPETADPSHAINLMTTPVRDLLAREPICEPPTSTICDVARRMSEHRVSSMLITEGERLVGIVTDRDLRNRVIAEQVDCHRPVSEVMTPDPLTVQVGDFAFEAMLLMARKNVHHLPVVDGGIAAGMITATDLTERQAASAVYLVGDIYKQRSVDRMREATAKIPQILVSLAGAGATAQSIGHVITALGDAVTTRLLQLAEEELGSPPVPYAWIAAGSQARNEQTAKSDQDNCMVIDDAYDEAEHGDYFRALSRRVCDGLDACGYVYCPGEMMAMTDEWRQPLATWRGYFDKWVNQPEPKALMLTCVFFDLRCIYGEETLFKKLRDHFLELTRGKSIFLAHMAANALSHQPPLGFFRNFVLIKGGEHDHTFDMKHNGIIPIVDLARVYALAAGIDAVNTQERLSSSLEGSGVSAKGAQDLRDALEFISHVRIQHQAQQIRDGEKPDNFMSPDELSPFERSHLKEAFAVVRTMQGSLASRFQTSTFG